MSQKKNVRQKERKPRLPANDRVRIDGIAAEAWAVNWSRTGSCLLVEEELKNGQRVNVEFPDRYVRGEAQVVWSQRFPDGCLVGLEFIKLDRRAVSSRLPSPRTY
jgi:hypothetical protein